MTSNKQKPKPTASLRQLIVGIILNQQAMHGMLADLHKAQFPEEE